MERVLVLKGALLTIIDGDLSGASGLGPTPHPIHMKTILHWKVNRSSGPIPSIGKTKMQNRRDQARNGVLDDHWEPGVDFADEIVAGFY